MKHTKSIDQHHVSSSFNYANTETKTKYEQNKKKVTKEFQKYIDCEGNYSGAGYAVILNGKRAYQFKLKYLLIHLKCTVFHHLEQKKLFGCHLCSDKA